MLARLLLVVAVALLPSAVGAQGPRPNALEVGAGVATCMTEGRIYPPEGGVAVYGTIHQVTLIEDGLAFATIRRRVFDPAQEPWLANDPEQPPMTLDPLIEVDEMGMRETLRYAVNCFGKVYGGA